MKLELEDLVVSYGSGSGALVAVDRVSFALPEGTTLGLVGGSGCGKSTIARAVLGLVPLRSGRVLLDGKDFTAQRQRDSIGFKRQVQMVFQDPYSSLNPRMTVREIVAEVMPRDGSGRDKPKEARRVLELVGLPASTLERYPHQFSGGQRQRIAIARALAVRPDVIINDEVTSALDVSVQANLLNLLKDLQKELGLSYVFISHDLAAVRYMSDSIAVMYMGRVVESAQTDRLLSAPQHPYTNALIQSIPKLGQQRPQAPVSGELPDPRRPPPGCRFHTLCPIGPLNWADRSICAEHDPQTIASTQVNRAACHFAGEPISGPNGRRTGDRRIVTPPGDSLVNEST